ncbi:MAG: hypothetical protein R3E89_13065 [Thiolinea sp.]
MTLPRFPGRRAALAAYGSGVVLADFSQPHQPQVLHTATFSKQAEAIAVAAGGQRLYVANGSAGLDILALAPDGSLQLLGRLDTPLCF